MKILLAVTLSMACGLVLAKDEEGADAAKKAAKPAAAPSVKKTTNENVGRATAKPFLTGEAPRNPFDVPLLRDARTFDSVDAPQGRYVLR
jgi:hypothetical protein